MTTPDNARARRYAAEVAAHHDSARALARHLANRVGDLRQRLDAGAKTFGVNGAELVDLAAGVARDLAALDALAEVEFLTADPEAGE